MKEKTYKIKFNRVRIGLFWLIGTMFCCLFPIAFISLKTSSDFFRLLPFLLFLSLAAFSTAIVSTTLFILAFEFSVSKDGLSQMFARLSWNDISNVEKQFLAPFYILKGSSVLGLAINFIIIPALSMLEDKKMFLQAVNEMAPEGHVVRKFFGARSEEEVDE